MSDGAISQDEIDALLSGVDVGGVGSAPAAPKANIDTATLGKFASGLKDKLSANLNTMTGANFSAGEPTVEVCNRDQLLAKIPEMVVAVMADFNAGLQGDHLFILSPEFSQKLCGLINKEEITELDEMALSVISEVVSQHSGSEITDLTQGGKLPGLASNPAEAVHVPKAMVRIPQGDFALFTYTVTLDGESYSMWEAVSSDVANSMAVSLGGGAKPAAQAAGGGTLSAADMQGLGGMAMGAAPQQAMGGMAMGGMQMGGMPMGGQPMMGGMAMGGMQMGGMPMGGQPMMGGMPMNIPNVQTLQYPNLAGGPTSSEQGNIGLIMDVFMEMTVELGRTKKQIKEILGMGEGTIIELDKLAGEPVDILVNHKPIAKGEVVVIDENFGVRVTEILSPMERVSDLH
ncbi:MAG: flagellar motor switch protein FliN [Treponema sp.]|nr:flagellar motor switch protein FliN [Treponema sp.]